MNRIITASAAICILLGNSCSTGRFDAVAPVVHSLKISNSTCGILDIVSKEFPKARNLDGNLTDFFMLFDPPDSNFEYADEFFTKRNPSLYYADLNPEICEITIRGEIDYISEILEIVNAFDKDIELTEGDFRFSHPRSIDYGKLCVRLGLRPRVKLD